MAVALKPIPLPPLNESISASVPYPVPPEVTEIDVIENGDTY